jgi:hypothetical protein
MKAAFGVESRLSMAKRKIIGDQSCLWLSVQIASLIRFLSLSLPRVVTSDHHRTTEPIELLPILRSVPLSEGSRLSEPASIVVHLCSRGSRSRSARP